MTSSRPRQRFELAEVTAEMLAGGERWRECVRVPALSVGVYQIPTGGEDDQAPHHEDEIYVVLHGTAVLRAGDEDIPVEPGSVVHVPAEEEHRFHSIEGNLQVLVVFAPAET
jgi:mannose-6-phosphate isomerase-like protein (cupin superfamily)